MKLLLDQNLSRRLGEEPQGLFPGTMHVRSAGLDRASDTEVRDFAKAEGFAIVSKDSDFQQRSLLFGHPPKCIWLKVGNCPTETLKRLIQDHAAQIESFGQELEESYLILP